jgi:endonuclease/exonuclease/phosphatase family metal-dependent hydrolase
MPLRTPGRAAALAALLVLTGMTFQTPSSDAQPRAASSASVARTRHAAGTTARIVAKHALGAPLHPAPNSPRVSARLSDGVEVRIVAVRDRRWLEVEAGATRGFLLQRYLASPRTKERRELAATSPWSGRAACHATLQRTAPLATGAVRVGAWNLRWFPDGKPGSAKAGAGTDVVWLACAIAFMRVDVLAIAEIKQGADAERALVTLLAELNRLTGGDWKVELDGCPRASSQRVGLLFDARRARLQHKSVIAELNPHGEPCRDQLRPGLLGYFRFGGGLDLSIVATHLKSGSEERSFDLRNRSFAAFTPAAERARALGADADVLVLGDMNTMGCESCSPPISATAELARASAQLDGAAVSFRRLNAYPACSHVFARGATLLDWAAASDLTELPKAGVLTVAGPCGELGCSDLRAELPFHRRLSDHCPVYVDLHDQDLDPSP